MNLANWKQTEHVTMVADDGENEQEYRLSFGTMTAYAEAKFNRMRLKLITHLEERFGKYADADDEAKEDIDILFLLMLKHAGVMATLSTVERKDEKGKWQKASLPDEWNDVFTFAENCPAGLIDDLFIASIRAGNSLRVFGLTPQSDDEKKMIRLNVRKSDN